jgi:hypothetical protein
MAGLFASCHTGSIMKRHYNKGYYVSKKHKPAGTYKAPTEVAEKAPAIEPEVIEKIASSSESAPSIEPQIAQSKTETKNVTKPSKKIRNIFKEESVSSASFAPRDIMMHPFSPVKTLKAAVGDDDLARDALSLIWIVIVVLLILYIVGLIFDLFGVGPVFHILGGIILVLLVLWLLRII